MALTVPNPPLITLYPVWILGCSMYAWAAYTRKSFGMIANYLLLVTIESIHRRTREYPLCALRHPCMFREIPLPARCTRT